MFNSLYNYVLVAYSTATRLLLSNSLSLAAVALLLLSPFSLSVAATVKPLVNLVLVSASLYTVFSLFGKNKNLVITNTILFILVALVSTLITLTLLPDVVNFTISTINSAIFIDGVSLWLLWLSGLVLLVLFLGINGDNSNFVTKFYNRKVRASFSGAILAIIVFSAVCFLVKNLFIFFIFFEMILVPLVFHIITQGSRVNSIQAVKYLVMFTLAGSVFLWLPIVYFIEILGTADFDALRWIIAESLNSGTRKLLFLSLFVGFSFKVPMVPLHQWLIIAHVEAPTTGSIVLAALLLKVGGYGLYRFVYNLFPVESFSFSLEIIAIALFGYSYATLLAIKQTDIKRFIAYTSISHMNFSLIGLFSGLEIGVGGFIHTMISHGIIATGMFYLVGYLYTSLGYRDTLRISGLSETVPVFSIFWFLFSIANMGMPMFSAFPGEFFILISLVGVNPILGAFTMFGFFFTGAYSFIQITKLLFSNYRGFTGMVLGGKTQDLSGESTVALILLLTWTIILGVCPDIVLKSLEI